MTANSRRLFDWTFPCDAEATKQYTMRDNRVILRTFIHHEGSIQHSHDLG